MRTLIIAAFALFAVDAAHAQLDDFERSRRNTAAYYNYAEEGDLTVHASVWGAVRYPGYYETPVGTHLSELLSIAGGPTAGERSRRSKRKIIVKLYRDSGAGRQVVYEQVATNGIDAAGRDFQIVNGDVLAVESVVRQRFGFNSFFSLVAAFASVTLAVERLAN